MLVTPIDERRMWLRLLAPDDVADLIQAVPTDQRAAVLASLDAPMRSEVAGLLAATGTGGRQPALRWMLKARRGRARSPRS